LLNFRFSAGHHFVEGKPDPMPIPQPNPADSRRQPLPWYAITIGAGAMLLAAPLLLRPFPDSFVNGSSALVVFAVGAAAIAVILWACGTQQNVIDLVN